MNIPMAFFVMVGVLMLDICVRADINGWTVTVVLERRYRGIVPCPSIASHDTTGKEWKNVSWYFSGMEPDNLLISYYQGEITLYNRIPEGVYGIDGACYLVIENVTDSNWGEYYVQLEPGDGENEEGVVIVQGGLTVYLERGIRGIVPCLPIKNNEVTVEGSDAVYWYHTRRQSTRHLISYFRGHTQPQEGIPEGVYDIDDELSLVIENVTYEDDGEYIFKLKPRLSKDTMDGAVTVEVYDGGSVIIFLERGRRGIVPCPPITSHEFTVENTDAVYWYFSRMNHTFLLVSYIRGEVSTQNGVPRSVYDIDAELSLVIGNVTDSDEGDYFFTLKAINGPIKEGKVAVSVIDVLTDHPSNTWIWALISVMVLVVVAMVVAVVIIHSRLVRRNERRQLTGDAEEGIPLIKTRTAQDAADRCEEVLKKLYSTTGSYVQMMPWVDDDKKHIMDIFTPLKLVKDSDKKNKLRFDNEEIKHKRKLEKEDNKDESQSLQDIFLIKDRDGYLINRAILEGWPGMGKTTLFAKVAYDWAHSPRGKLKKYKLVFKLKMNALQQESELIDAIFDQLLDQDTPIQKPALKSFIATNPDKILILLDGFDEFMTTSLCEASFGSILKMLNRQVHSECFVIVSTRLSHFRKLTKESLITKPFTHVKVMGFDEEAIEQYVGRFFTNEPEKKPHGLLVELKSLRLSELAKSPMLLLLMCLLWREDCKLPDTMSRLYDKTLEYIFKRKTTIPRTQEMSTVVIQIGKIALSGLLSPTQLLSFQESEFEKSVLDLSLRVGILTSERVIQCLAIHNSVQFIHKTFQECCAGKYLQSLLKADIGEFEKKLDQIDDPDKFDYVLRFCCGDNEECTDKVLQRLHGSEIAASCFFECQSEKLPPVNLINSVVSTTISINSESNTWPYKLYLLKRVADLTKDNNVYLVKVEIFIMKDCNIQQFCDTLENSLSAMTNLQMLHLMSCSLKGKDVRPIAMSIGKMPALVELDLSGNKQLGGSGTEWAPHLQYLTNLQRLHLGSCSLIGNDVKPIAMSIGKMPALVEFDLSDNCDLGGSGTEWAPHLQEMKNLQTLGLQMCSLIGDDVKPIALSIGKMPALVKLNLSCNNGLGKSGTEWAPYLQEMKNLQTLGLRMCSLIGDDVKPIALSIGKMPALVKLNLSYNNGLGGSGTEWAPYLQEITNLQKLDLSGCSLIGNDVNPIATSIGKMPALDELDLSGNRQLSVSGTEWAPHLQEMKMLQKLNLSSCSLKSKDVKPIALSIGKMPALVKLNFSYHDDLGGLGTEWAPHLQEMKTLQKLHLSSCSLKGKDVKPIAMSIGKMPALVELNLSNNDDLGGSGAQLAPHL